MLADHEELRYDLEAIPRITEIETNEWTLALCQMPGCVFAAKDFTAENCYNNASQSQAVFRFYCFICVTVVVDWVKWKICYTDEYRLLQVYITV